MTNEYTLDTSHIRCLLYIPSSSVNINNYFNVFQIRGYNADNGNDGSYHDISTTSEKR